MKTKLLSLLLIFSMSFCYAQRSTPWLKQTSNRNSVSKVNHINLIDFQTFTLNTQALQQQLANVPDRSSNGVSGVIISFPTSEGKLERFSVKEASVMHPNLQSRYPDIRSFVGQSIDDASSVIRFSLSPYGFSGMILSPNGQSSFIESESEASNRYIVFSRRDRLDYNDDFVCEVTEQMNRTFDNGNVALRNADDSILRTYRLAVSATGEYTQYHGGTKAQALAAINTTMTRVNGIYEVDFNVTMVLISNTDDVIYTSTSSDPYGNTTSGYNTQLQNTLTNVIGEANYDVGHLFANLQNNGNAGCIGCVCVNGQKGSGWTSHTVPEGDPFDVDYVAHELGHQFGGNHTFTFSNEGTGAQMEPGSGSTIMGYAGITGSTDVQSNSDPYFHAASIEQITNYIKTTSCQTNTNTGNAVPVVNAGSNLTIPRGTPFVLDGTATDADTGDVLTYCWEQYDVGSPTTTNPSVNNTSGTAFRSFSPSTDSKRYFPRLSTIKTGSTSWQWEAVPNVARTLTFRLTVRDNQAGGGTNNSDDILVTVNGTAGPFVLTAPNTNVTWNAGTTQNVTWDVAGTTGNGINAANVDIYLSTDGGDTYPIALATGVPNDGSHAVVVPNNQGNQNRVMVKGSNNIFFDISNSNFTIAGQVVCNATVPTGLNASNVGPDSATLSWDAVPGANYDVQYRQVGAGTWIDIADVVGVSTNLSGLSTLTQYEARVRSECPDTSTSAYSSIINFTTTDVQLNYCTSQSTNINDEYIGRVQLNTIDNSSGGQFYSDFTGISTTLTKDTQYSITVTPTWTGTVYPEGYSVWIDYNRDGDFTDAGEQVFSQAATTATPVSGSFTVPSSAVENSTTMRVSMKYNGIPTSCETFTYGEVEDYTIVIEGSGPDTVAPVITLIGASTLNINVGDTYTEQGATASDNVDGDISANIVIGGDTVDTNTAGTYVVTYNVSDSAGNAASEVIRTVNVNPDTTAPIITLIGASTINLTVGDSYTEQGATASDNVDGDITASIIIGGDVVDTNTAGTYLVTYNVSDAAGNVATEVVRTVNVNPDSTAPVITLIGSATINLNVGDTYTEQGATANDNVDGDITASIIIGGDVVDTNTAGTYLVTYNVSDAAGNAATEVVRTVNVSEVPNGCSGGITAFPYSESFENTLGSWTQSTADDLNWTVDASGTPSSGTGPSSASLGSYYIYVEASGNGTGYPNKRAILNSPCFNLSALTSASFSFDVHMYGAADMGTIGLEISTDDGNSWSSIWNLSGNQGNSWFNVDVDLTAYTGGGIQLRFNRFVGSTWQADIAIDNVNLAGPPAPDTQAPTAATLSASNTTENSTDLTWTGASDNVGVTDYDVYQNGSFIANVTNSSYNVTGLSESTAYNFYVVANDAAGNSSPNSNTVNLTTLAAPTCSDGIQNGDETGVDCGGSCAPCPVTNVTLNEGYFETGWDSWIDGGSDCARLNTSYSFEGNYSIRIRDNSGTASSMTLNNVDVTPYSQIEVDFYFYVFSMENNEDFWLRFYDGSQWNTVQTWTRGVNINNNTFYNATVVIDPAQYNFAVNSGFRFQNDASGNNDQIYIDQVTITGISGTSKGDANNLLALGTLENDIAFEEDMRLFPNPVGGYILNVEIPNVTTFDYKIFNMIGQSVLKGNTTGKIDVSTLEGGMYFIEVNDGDELLIKKFIKR